MPICVTRANAHEYEAYFKDFQTFIREGEAIIFCDTKADALYYRNIFYHVRLAVRDGEMNHVFSEDDRKLIDAIRFKVQKSPIPGKWELLLQKKKSAAGLRRSVSREIGARHVQAAQDTRRLFSNAQERVKLAAEWDHRARTLTRVGDEEMLMKYPCDFSDPVFKELWDQIRHEYQLLNPNGVPTSECSFAIFNFEVDLQPDEEGYFTHRFALRHTYKKQNNDG